jgi:glycogen operon protein
MGRITEIFSREVWSKAKTPYVVGRGKPLPLGATVTPEGINFAVFAEHARAVTLVLLRLGEDVPYFECKLEPHYNKTGHIWHVQVFALAAPIQYGYKMDGTYDPGRGHRYDKHVLLFDPYAKALSRGKVWGCREEVTKNFRQKENRRYSLVVDDPFDWQGDFPPLTPMRDTIIYEMHVRGFTQHPASRVKNPGSFEAVSEKLPYLKELGITAVELMPVCEFDENDNPNRNPFSEEPLKNFWGYNTVGFFSPKASYAANKKENGHLQEFKELVRACHKAGIEVILDVVFNHTAEGNENGPTLHFRGLDNQVYYILGPGGRYLNFSGCGNTVNCNHPLIRDFIIDCLRYWVTEMHVDGFRFDLAAVLGRDENGEVLKNPPIIERIARDPVLSNTKLIAEAWDAAGLYQVGTFPACGRWAEWNGKFRDDVRCFVRGDDGFISALAMRLLGSPDLYDKYGRYPYHSINFVTCHDGFTLHDQVSYNHKHNEMNGENNRDGTEQNFSWNCGLEGETGDASIIALRQRQMRNFLAILMLSQGVPMLLSGDESARSQQGNNNAYCQDNEISWLNWKLAEQHRDMFRFTKELIAFRKRHRSLRQEHFLSPNQQSYCGIQWHGVKKLQPDWSFHSHSIAFLLEGSVVPGGDNDIYVAINAYWETLTFEIPAAPSQQKWHILMDTGQPSPEDIFPENESEKRYMQGDSYTLLPRSLVVLIASE